MAIDEGPAVSPLPASVYLLTFGLLFGLICIPLWATDVLPLRDYQSRLAGMAIIVDGGRPRACSSP
jgi:hypothetical protein